MILQKTPLTLAQAKSLVANLEEKLVLQEYFKKFNKITVEKATELMSEIRALNNPKIKEEHLIKFADILPQDAEDVNKICSEVSLSEEESRSLLTIIKNYS